MQNLIQIEERNGVQVVDSRIIAEELGVEHRATLQVIEKYQDSIESLFGVVAFEMLPDTLGRMNTPVRVAYLTEDQAIFIATLSRNSEQVVKFKARLVQAFQAARKFIAPLNPAEMKLQVFRMLEQEAESLKVQLQLANTTIKQQAPKVKYFEEVLDTTTLLPSSVVADDFGKSANWLHEQLKSRGIMWKVGGVWVLTSKYKDKGYTEIKPYPYIDSLGQQKTKNQTYWTEKGRHFLHTLFDQQKAA